MGYAWGFLPFKTEKYYYIVKFKAQIPIDIVGCSNLMKIVKIYLYYYFLLKYLI